MAESIRLTRRAALGLVAGATGALVADAALGQDSSPLKGRINHSACRWCYGQISLEDLCAKGKAMGLKGIDLLSQNEWAAVKQAGLICSMANGPSGIADGWNKAADHDRLVKESERLLPLVKEAGLPNMILLAGNLRGMTSAESLDNCVTGIKRITPLAEQLGVTLCMELLNSKRDHKDYACDHTAWGVELVKRVGSPRLKLLYDIYHMQIMEGDVIDTIQRNHEFIGHYHTGGVPGRREIDETQELNYRRIMQAIAETGFKGFVAQEFIPARDPMTSLSQAIRICDV